MIGDPAEAEAEQQPRSRSDQTDDQTLHHEYPPNRSRRGTLSAEDRYVAVLFDHHHRQRRDDVESRDGDQQREENVDYAVLQLERRIQRAVQLLPVLGHKTRPGDRAYSSADFLDGVYVRHFHLDRFGRVAAPFHLLRG